MKLALALFALSSSALAQTTTPPAPAKPATQHAATSATAATHAKSTTASTLPKVAGIPHTLYSLKYTDIKIGTGPISEPQKYYTVNYTGYFPDGTKFDSTVDPSFKHPTPFTFPYGAQRVIIGWDTGFEGMHVGGKRRLYVPYQLAYGIVGRPPKMAPKANLIFDVELLSFSDKAPTPPAPPVRPTPPADSVKPTAPSTPAAPTAPATPPSTTAPAEPAKPTAPVTPPAPATAPTAPTPPPSA